MSTIPVNIEWLSDCSGCHVAIVDLHEKILAVLQAISIRTTADRMEILADLLL